MKLSQVLLFASGLLLTQTSNSISLFDIDSNGNVNQINIGVGKEQTLNTPASSGPTKERNMNLGAFSELEISAPVELVYTQGGGNHVKLKGPEAALNALRVEQNGSKVIVETQDNFSASGQITVEASSTRLTALVLEGAVDATLRRIDSPRLRIQLSGAVNLSGSGRSSHCILNTSGSADVALDKLRCDKVELTVTGSSDLSVYAGSSISGRVGGASDVSVEGNPAQRSVSTSGAADVDYD